NMRHFLLFLVVLLIHSSCTSEAEGRIYTGKEIEYELFQASGDYNYHGKVVFTELKTGEIEIVIQLVGENGNETYYFPAHLHFGAYDTPDAPMAAMLTPVDIRT